MKSGHQRKKFIRGAISIILMLSLVWLTISLPFVYNAREASKQLYSSTDTPVANEEECDNSLINTTEEKSSNVNSALEEFLHDVTSDELSPVTITLTYRIEQVSTYIAFYGELISPPPDSNC